MKVHLSDIAKKLGVSKMTVSRALREDPAVAPATREKIKEVAKELGYTPNPKLARLMYEIAKSRKAVGILGELAYITTSHEEFSWQKYYHQLNCFEGAKAEALDYGYNLIPVWAPSRRFGEDRLTNFLWSRGVDGVIIAPLGPAMIGKTLALDWDKFCCVQIGATLTTPRLNLVRHNHYGGMVETLRRLEALGYRKIGMCTTATSDLRSYHRWTSAYLHWRTVRRYSAQDLPSFYYEPGMIDKKLFKEWLKTNRIEAFISMGADLLEVCREIGVKIPDDVGFSVLDRPEDPSEVAGIDQNAWQIGRKAVDNLITSVRKGAKGVPECPIESLVEGHWTEAKTVRRLSEPTNKDARGELENIEGSF